MLRAIRGFRARPDIVHCCLWLVGRLRRQGHLFIQGGLLQQLLLLHRDRRRDGASPLPVEKRGILFVDVLLFFRRRIRTRYIETPVLHEIEIGVAAAYLAPSGEFSVAFGERRAPCFLGRRLLPTVAAFLEIGRSTPPPLPVHTQTL